MDTLLIEEWMWGADPHPTIDDASISVARELVRGAAQKAGLPRIPTENLALAASELVRNQLRHARLGHFAVRPIRRGAIPGLELIAADHGPGLADPATALAGPGLSARSLGEGIAGARRVITEMDVDVRQGEGTCFRARVFAEPVPRGLEVGILGRPLAEERVSGDRAVFARIDGELVLAVIDGIGHGALARDAAALASSAVLESAALAPAGIVEACSDAVAGSRGVVLAVERLGEETGTLSHACVGNITVRLDRFRSSHTLASSASALGQRGRRHRCSTEQALLEPGGVLLMFTDGLSSRAGLEDAPDLHHEHPIVVAQRLLTEFARDNDDALILVVR